jgi:hypothetical protein
MNNYRFFAKEKGTRATLITILNAATMLLTSVAVYFATFFPIGEVQFKEKETAMLTYREELLDMAAESKLTHEDGETYLTVYESYQYYTQMLLKYTYEHGGYDLDKDTENYKLKQEGLTNLHEIKVEGDLVKDNYFGEFYTSYIVGKNDSEGKLILELNGKTPKEYFYYEVLDIDGAGKNFFKETTGDFPFLKDEVRKNLYDYNLLKSMTNDAYNTDQSFFSYFVNINNNAGDLLMKYNDYASKLKSHDEIYYEIENYSKTAIFVTCAIGFVATIVIFPLFNKFKRTPAEMIFGRVYLNDTNEGPKFKISSFVIRAIYGLVKYFFVFLLVSFVIDLNVSFGSLFYLGTFPISLFSIATVFLMVNALSLCISMLRADRKNLENLLSKTRVYSIEKDLTSTEK